MKGEKLKQMNKKHLVTLLVLPLLLTSCGGGKEPEPNPGEKGEDVLTVEQRAEMLSNETVERTYGAKYLEHSAYEFDEADGFTSVYESDPFHIYKKEHASDYTEWTVVSDLVGRIGGGQRGNGYVVTSPLVAAKHSYSFTGAGSIYYLMYSAAYESGGGLKNIYNELVDQFGNTIYSSKKLTSQEYVDSISPRVNTVVTDLNGHTEKEYLLDVNIYNIEEDVATTKTLKYGADFRTLTVYQDSTSIFRPTGNLKYVFTEDEVKYTIEQDPYGFKISHTEKTKKEEKEVVNYFTIPAGADIRGAVIGHNYLYQRIKPLNDFDTEYNYAKNDGTLYQIHTYRVNLMTLETEEISFPYEITAISTNFFLKDQLDGKLPTEIITPKYAVASLNKIENKVNTGHTLRCVVDQNLALRDDLTTYDNGYIPFGKEHYRKVMNGDLLIYDKQLKLVGRVEGFTVDDTRSGYDYLSGKTFANKWGVVGEDGKFIIEPHYSSCLSVAYYNYLCFVDGNERLIFHRDTLKSEVVVKDPERTYDNVSSETDPGYLYVERGYIPEGETEYTQDNLYLGAQKLVSFDHTASAYTRIYYYSYSYNNNSYRWHVYRFTTADGNQVTFSLLVTSIRK